MVFYICTQSKLFIVYDLNCICYKVAITEHTDLKEEYIESPLLRKYTKPIYHHFQKRKAEKLARISLHINLKKGYEMILTKHGKQRIKERLGLPKRAHERHVKSVLSKGVLYSREGWKKFQVVYQGFLYVFVLEYELNPILITTYKVKREIGRKGH